ncbi:MAG: putative deoxycytidine triphosphate deaminase [candidate division WS6 bacterium 34_10]|jgi:dCTP deaminase|uniref:Putative deoxycytidine triphosphate deaminase n=1 Tax=candidate division WS6 bacterium 34_10 TaxID=1641389 RepID=A0A101HIV4_9BACT|nr:MAG: putative deoxycytidine triphosphate deaminase [candidate division WS6 bacterium 34_10]
MILTGHEIKKQVKKGRIVIDPFDESNLQPNSYDFHLSRYLKIYTNKILDPKKENKVKEIEIPEEGFLLKPDELYLGMIEETMGSKHYVPILRGRSSTGRLGLFVHITADLIDIGSINNWTLMLHSVIPVRVYSGMKIGQVTFWLPKGEIELYDGKYQGSSKPMESQSFKDYQE